MIYLKIVIELILLAAAYGIGLSKGYKNGVCIGNGICEDCQREIFEAGWTAGTENLLLQQEVDRQEFLAVAELHRVSIGTKEKEIVAKKSTKKVAKKKVAKKNK